MKRPTWTPCHSGLPCPVCYSTRPGRPGPSGAARICRVRSDGVVWCTTEDVVKNPGIVVPGFWLIRHPKAGEEGCLFSPIGENGDPKVKEAKPPGDAARNPRDTDHWKRLSIDRAVSIWKGTIQDKDGRVAGYLKARGIDISRWPRAEHEPEGLPAAIRFHPRCPAQSAKREAETGPAMVARIVEIGEKDGRQFTATTGIHRTFLDPGGEHRKRDAIEESEWWSDPKQMLGACEGRAVWLSSVFPSGALLAGEGIETTGSAMSATGLGGWCFLSAHGLTIAKLHLRLLHPKTGPVQTIIVCADLNRPPAAAGVLDVFLQRGEWRGIELTGKESMHLATLERAAEKIAGELVPGLPMVEARRIAALPPGLKAASILKLRVEVVYPWITVVIKAPTAAAFPELVEVADGVERRVGEGDKGSVDWNDCLVRCGPERVRAALLDGVDLAANHVRARGWDGPVGEAGDVDEDDGLREDSPGGPSPDPSGDSQGHPVAPAAAGSGGSGGKGTGGGPRSSGGAGDDKPKHARDDRDWGRLVSLEDRTWRPLLPWDDLELARLFLDRFYAPRKESRPNSGMHLIAMPGPKKEVVLHRFDGVAWSEISSRVIEGQVQDWLTPAAVSKPLKHGTEHVPFEPTATKVRDVTRAIENAVLVQCDEDRFWMTPGFDERGASRWGRAPWDKFDKLHQGKPAPDQILTFQNVQLARSDLVRGVWNPMRPSPLLYNRTYFPYELPLEEFEDCLVNGSFSSMTDRLAPTWKSIYLKGLEWSAAECNFLQICCGYWMCFDLSHKEANLVVFNGIGNTGKGTCEEAVQLIVGRNNISKTSIDDVAGDRFHLASFRHKLLAVVSEQERTDRSSRAKFLRVVKTLTGGDSINTRQMYERERENDRLWVRWLLSCNEMIDLEDESAALLNRLRVLDFRRETERVDRSVKARVMQEGLGLVIWGIEGMINGYGEENFTQPAESTTPLNVFADFSASNREFVAEWLVITQGPKATVNEPEAFLEASKLHEAYCRWKGWDPSKISNAAVINKKLLAMLRVSGWRGQYSQPLKAEGEQRKRASGWTGLKLSGHALQRIDQANAEAKGQTTQWTGDTGPSGQLYPPH